MTRRFSINERRALFMLADGKCENCGQPLPDNWHADHKTAWSRDGETDVTNGQALCPICNWKKGASVMMTFDDLRPWQQAFLAAYLAHLDRDFLLVCLPGGGKTYACLAAAQQWLKSMGTKPRLIIHLAPLRELKKQFRRAAKAFGIQVQIGDFDGKIKAGMQGLCFTYAGLGSIVFLLRVLCAKYDVMVIFDEPHHMSDEAVWGKNALESFEHATRRLFMTGTPWRQDMNSIPFIAGKRQPDGTYQADFTFDWPLALQEKDKNGKRCIRILAFRYFDDVVDYEDSETRTITSIDSRDFSLAPDWREKERQDRWLNGAIRGSALITAMIEAAHAKLMEVRAHKPNAAGLVVCEDQRAAERVAARLKKITGVTPHLIVSDDEISSDTTEDFDRQKGVWIVSVRKVSEAIDIPRLIVGVYLTNYRTELYFRQFVGRVARNQGTEFDSEAYVFIPKHWLLMEFARKIEEVQAVALTMGKERDGGGGGVGAGTVYVGDDAAQIAGVLLPNSKSESADVSAIDNAMARYRHLGMTETLAAQLLRDGKLSGEPENEPSREEYDDLPLEEQMDTWRTKIVAKKVRRLALLRGAAEDETQYKRAASEANDSVGIKRGLDATLDQLKAMSAWLDRKIAEEESRQ